MVFVIPDRRENPVNQQASNVAALLQQRQSNKDLASILGIEGNTSNLTPEQMKLLAAQKMQQQKLNHKSKELEQIMGMLGVNPFIPSDEGFESSQAQTLPQQGQLQTQEQALPAQERVNPQVQNVEFSDEQIAAISVMNPKLAEILQKQKEQRTVRGEKLADRNFEMAKPLLEEAQKFDAQDTQQEVLIDTIHDSIVKGNLSSTGRDFWADKLHMPALRSAEGAAFKSAIKEQLVGSLKGIPGKGLNQFLETRLDDALAKIGQSKEANLSALEIARSKHRIMKKRSDVIQDMYEEHIEKSGKVPPNFNRLVNRRMEEEAKKEQEFISKRLEDIKAGRFEGLTEQKKAKLALPEGRTRVQLPDGRTAHLPNEQVEAFLQAHKDAKVMQ